MTIWGNPPAFVPTKPKKGKVITPESLAASGTEDGSQMAVFCWAAGMCGQYPQLKWLHSIPNGGSRHIVEAGKMVAAGARSGVWDIFLPCPIRPDMFQDEFPFNVKPHNGCYIEMKRAIRKGQKNGGLEDNQVEFKDYAEANGYYCKVCYSWIEARDTLVAYLEGKL